MHRVLRSRRDQAQLTHDHNLSQPRSRSSCHSSCLRPGLPARRGGAAMIFTVHEAGPAARARCASGRSEAARWRAGGPDRGGLAVSSPVEALMLCGATACWLGLHSLSQTLCCREAGSNEWCEGWVVRGQRRKGSFYQSPDANRAPDQALARSRPRGGRSSFRRRAAHQARIGPCGAPSVGIRRAGNRPMSTKWRHAASGRVVFHTPPDRAPSPKMGCADRPHVGCLPPPRSPAGA